MISRAEAQVMRLACLYALQDMSSVVRPEHLTAALALWEYCEASARYILGQRLGDPLADELLSALRKHANGMTRTEIRDWCVRNRKSYEIDRALAVLQKRNLARMEESHTFGRPPTERWFALTGVTTYTTYGRPYVVYVVYVVRGVDGEVPGRSQETRGGNSEDPRRVAGRLAGARSGDLRHHDGRSPI